MAKLDDGNHVRFLDIGAKFLVSDGKINPALLPEGIHPSAAGYAVQADAMQPLLNDMLGGWRSLSPDFAARIRKNRSNTAGAAEERWMTRLPASVVAEANVPYAPSDSSDPRLTSLDVFHPAQGPGKLPIIVFVHGGGFSAGDKSSEPPRREQGLFFPAHGFVFVSVNYRLGPRGGLPDSDQGRGPGGRLRAPEGRVLGEAIRTPSF